MSKHRVQPGCGELAGRRKSRDRIFRREQRRGKFNIPAELATSKVGKSCRFMPGLFQCYDYTYIYSYSSCKNYYFVCNLIWIIYYSLALLYICVCVFIKLHIMAQSGPVILVIPCQSH